MTSTIKAPVFFISHGAPTLAIEPGELGARLQTIGHRLTGIKAVLIVSPHWQTREVTVMTTLQPETVHDFGGFPAALYELQYPVAGQPELARTAARLLVEAGFTVDFDGGRGLDHGAWVPLYHLLPQAQVPVFQVSMPATLDAAQAVKLGRALSSLREHGVLIVGSGSMTHNLYEFRHSSAQPEAYVQEFTTWVQAAVLAKGVQQLVDYRAEAPHAQRAHPSEEHFLPLLIAMGAVTETDQVTVLQGGITNGVLSMESYAWGLNE